MGRIDKEHMALPRLGGVQGGLQLGVEKIGLDGDVLSEVFLGARGWRAHAATSGPGP